MPFNKLESEIIQFLINNTTNESLKEQLQTIKFSDREYTGSGFFIDLETDEDAPPYYGDFPVQGPTIESPEIPGGATCTVWGENCYCTGIELSADTFPENLGKFTLKAAQKK